MRNKLMTSFCLVAALLLVGVTGMAQAETKLKQLGLNPFYAPELTSVDEFRQMVAQSLPDLKEGFVIAGASDLFENFVTQAGQPDSVVVVEVNPGEKLQWMIYKKEGKVKVIKDVVWVGNQSFTAFVLHVDRDGNRYTFVVPSKCGNVSLAYVSPLPVVAQELEPNIAPYCEVAVTPSSLTAGEQLFIDASKSTDPDGFISSVRIMVTGADNLAVQKKMDQPPFIHQIAMPQPGEYTIEVSAIDDDGLESSSPKCQPIKITVAPAAKIVSKIRIGNFVADAGYMFQDDPAEYLLFRLGYNYYLSDSFSILGMVGIAPVIDGSDDTDSFLVDLTGIYRYQRMYYGVGIGSWNSSTDDRIDIVVNVGYRFYGEADAFNISAFVEGRGAFDQLDEFDDYGRLGTGLRFQF